MGPPLATYVSETVTPNTNSSSHKQETKVSCCSFNSSFGQNRLKKTLRIKGLPNLKSSPCRPHSMTCCVKPFTCCISSFFSVSARQTSTTLTQNI
ncbi:uncharacterized protein G2W53_020137 [Senna tora]|uniref:Uncharacterized protein n=1 Tax=Senna tora TaxID=362788 RepID=A0A834TUV8_9FABA|nr:uncharacterized protein G2W53_020137 [Senna tora]